MIFNNLTKKLSFLSLCLFFIGFFKSAAQSEERYIANTHDSIVGKQSLAINNGYFHTNPYPVINGKFRYYNSENFIKGTLVYENQNYYDIDMKYDLYLDVLICKPSSESNGVGIEMIPQNVDGFILNNKKFVNIGKTVSPMIPFIKGYYEENLKGKNFVFYIKHHKDRREIINDTRTYNEFDNNYEFYICKNDSYYKISSKKDVIALFPDQKSKINDLYSMNKALEKENKYLFYDDLIRKINYLLENTTQP